MQLGRESNSNKSTSRQRPPKAPSGDIPVSARRPPMIGGAPTTEALGGDGETSIAILSTCV